MYSHTVHQRQFPDWKAVCCRLTDYKLNNKQIHTFSYKKELQKLSTPRSLFQLACPWLLPFLEPLVLIIWLLLFGPCFFSLFQRFLQDRIWAISQDQVKDHSSWEPHLNFRKRKPWALERSSVPDPKTVAPIQEEVAREIRHPFPILLWLQGL